MRYLKAVLTVARGDARSDRRRVPVAAQTIRGTVVLPDSATPVCGRDRRRGGRCAAQRRRERSRRRAASSRFAFPRRGATRSRFCASDSGRRRCRRSPLPPARPKLFASSSPAGRHASRDERSRHGDLSRQRRHRDSRSRACGKRRERRCCRRSSAPRARRSLAEWIEYDRTLDSGRALCAPAANSHIEQPDDARLSRARRRAARHGGLRRHRATGTTYYLPDAEVLLSPSFAAAHCFRLQAPPRGRGGPDRRHRFSPARDRRDVRDIEGTAWVDRQSAELRTLEIRYTNLPGDRWTQRTRADRSSFCG